MKKMLIVLILMAAFLRVSSSWAGTKDAMTAAWTSNTYLRNEKDLTPRQRIQENEKKAADNPSLRGRWNRRSQEPASEGSMVSDNLAEKILSKFREDDSLSKLPVKLKVTSSQGTVTLDGVVNNDGERSLFEKKVGQMEGVKKVVNHLKVKSSDQDLLD